MFPRLFIYLSLASFVSGEKVDMTVDQKPHDLIINDGESHEIKCFHKIPNYDRLLWYKQSQSKELTFMGYLLGENGYPEKAFENKIKIEGDANKFHGSLTLISATSENSAVYFCAAYSGGGQAFFGNGTKLTVLDPKIKVSERDDINVTVIRPSGQESCKKTVTLVCVARNFYPDHVSIQWMVGSSSRTDGVATDPYATKQGEDVETFTISSRLKVPIREWQNAKNKFKCQVLFYNGTEYLEREDAVYGIAGSDYTREDYIQSSQVMKLAYSMFIAKSGLYGLVIFVFVWRKGSSGK